MKKSYAWLIGIALLLPLAAVKAFADVEFAPIAEDTGAKGTLPPSGKALVFVFRGDGAAQPANVLIWFDSKRIGPSAPRSYYLWAVEPGTHTIASRDDRSVVLTLNVQAGRNYFVEQRLTADGQKVELRQVSYARGRVAVNRSRLIKDDSAFAAAAFGRPSTMREARREVGPAPKPGPPASRPAPVQGAAFILKTGSIKLSSRNQSIQTTTGTVPVEFDSKASSPLALEGEWRINNGFAVGVEYLRYSNDLTISGTSFASSLDFTGLMFNGKKYFAAGGMFYPYLGAGIGMARANFSGSALTGDTTGFAFQMMGGLELRWQQFGVYTEFTSLSAKTKDSAGNKVDAGSRGLFVGASMMF